MTRVTIENIEGSGCDIIVNVVERDHPMAEEDDERVISRHSIGPGDTITCDVHGWRRYAIVMEASPEEARDYGRQDRFARSAPRQREAAARHRGVPHRKLSEAQGLPAGPVPARHGLFPDV